MAAVRDSLKATQGNELSASALLAPLFRVPISRALRSIARAEAHVDTADPDAGSLTSLPKDLPHHTVDKS